MKCLIVDDDTMACTALQRLCGKQELTEVVGVCGSAEEALDFFKSEEPVVELLFLDMEMPGLSGLELLDRLSDMPMVIFTTSKVDYAFDAFEYGAIDFLKKPISQQRFEQAIKKVNSIQIENQQFQANARSFYVRTEGRYVRLDCNDILYFENVGDYIRVCTAHGGNHLIHGTLRSVSERLSDPRFLKVHRSYIVNLDKIVNIEENTILIGKSVIPISRAHKPILMNRLIIL